MKKIYFYISVLLSNFFYVLHAQPTMVSTQPTNKNVILEEFTGMYCHFCPDGHQIGNMLMQNYPGRVYSILIHQGLYAVPDAGDPDYRTPYGDALANQSGLTGYPAGTVNRHVFTNPAPMTPGGTAQTRGNWQSCATQIMNMLSPVNIAIDISLNIQTRQLTVLIEVYYTGNADSLTNKLNVALLQDYIKGPQNGSDDNPSQIAPDGQYYHMHMLRTFITGQWGWTIPQTTAGTFWDTAVVYTIPTSINGIPVDIGYLKVVAFVAEGKQEILTGTGKVIPHFLDASIISFLNLTEFSCENQIAPSVIIKNEGTDTIISYEIAYGVKEGFTDTLTFNDTLFPGQLKQISVNAFNVHNGYNVIFAKVLKANGIEDYRPFNDLLEFPITRFYSYLTLPYWEDFSSSTFPPPNISILDVTKDGKCWMHVNEGNGSAMIPFYYIYEDEIDELYLALFDFTSFQLPLLHFKIAHKMYASTIRDHLYIQISTDCGFSWVTKWYKGDPDLATAGNSIYPYNDPSNSDWRDEYVDLASYAGQQDVMIKFHAVSGYGNNLFIDNINIVEATALPEDAMVEMMMYPNPTSDYLHVLFNQPVKEPVQLRVYNTLGEMVFSDDIPTTYELTVRGWESGLYYVVIVLDNQVIKRSFVVQQ